jgi:DNA-binding XRE family transcriptional regulator
MLFVFDPDRSREGQGGRTMSSGRRWQDIKAEAHRRNPELAEPERQARARADLDAYVAGHHLKELRKAIGKTQAEVAQILGVSQSRVSQIENGDIEVMELETLRAYATALGGHADITVSVGPHSVEVA